ncbi:hypothetical protein CBL_04869 [Carabus blaptoides fortunei]
MHISYIPIIFQHVYRGFKVRKQQLFTKVPSFSWCNPNETWDNIVAVIDDIQRPSAIHPAVFLFLYNAEKKVINQLVHDLATYTSKKLETDRDFIEIQENEFLSEEAISDYGYLIDKQSSTGISHVL